MFIRQTLPDLNLETMLPAINAVTMGRYKKVDPQFPQLFRMPSAKKRGIEQVTGVSGFGQFLQTNETENTRYDTVVPTFNKTYRHAQYTLGFKVSRIAQDDDQFGVISKMSSDLGKSAAETRDVIAASVFNLGFTTVGPDGQALFSVNHPLVKSGGVQANMLPYVSDPDITSIQIALTAMRQWKDHSGRLIRVAPKKLIVPPAMEFLAAELLGGKERADTANHTINAFLQRANMPSFKDWMVYDYLTDPHAWFIQADVADTGMSFYDREPFNVTHAIDPDSRAIKTAGWMRFSVGFEDWYGIYGCPSS